MNISTHYTIPVGISKPNATDWPAPFPGKENNETKWLPVPVGKSPNEKETYNYYVADEGIDTIYNPGKTTEKIHQSSGALINIYA